MKMSSFEWKCSECTLDSGFLPPVESTRLSSHALPSIDEVQAIQHSSFIADESADNRQLDGMPQEDGQMEDVTDTNDDAMSSYNHPEVLQEFSIWQSQPQL